MNARKDCTWSAEPQLRIDLTNTQAELGLRAPRWYSRGYLPHYDDVSKFQAITFRLADSLPLCRLHEIEAELKTQPACKRDVFRRKRIEQWLDSGHGCCALGRPELARILEETLFRFHGNRYDLIAWCIMPNHVHTLILPRTRLALIVQSWKSFTGRWALARNAELGLGIPGKHLWMHDYWDRYMRNAGHLERMVSYIHQNPVIAGLCEMPEAWPWSSARRHSGGA